MLIATITSTIISAIILLRMCATYQSPADVRCEIDFIQRPDSVYQAQLYIWNDGDEVANNIVIWAKYDKVFQWDTSLQKSRCPLYIYPVFNVPIQVTSKKILNDEGKVQKFENHQITVTQLNSSKRDENYLIISPYLGYLEKWKFSPQSVYSDKYIKLKLFKGVDSYIQELKDNVKVIFKGRTQDIRFNNIISVDHTKTGKYIFPSHTDFANYRDKAVLPNNIVPPDLIKKKLIKDKNEEDKDEKAWYLLHNQK